MTGRMRDVTQAARSMAKLRLDFVVCLEVDCERQEREQGEEHAADERDGRLGNVLLGTNGAVVAVQQSATPSMHGGRHDGMHQGRRNAVHERGRAVNRFVARACARVCVNLCVRVHARVCVCVCVVCRVGTARTLPPRTASDVQKVCPTRPPSTHERG